MYFNSDILFKATKVNGIYSSDPKKDDKAKHFSKISYLEVLEKDLKIMDPAAIALLKETGEIETDIQSNQIANLTFIKQDAPGCTIT